MVRGRLRHSRQKWNEFVTSGGLRKVPLNKYYLESGFGGSGSAYPAKCEEVLSELFADAVAIGAVVLPAPYTVDNFRVWVNRRGDRAYVSFKENPGRTGSRDGRVEIPALPYLHDFTKMYSVDNLVLILAESVDELLA